MGLSERQREKLVKGAAAELRPGEQVRFAVAGQTGSPPGVLGSIMALAGRVKPRIVVGTDAAVYLLKGSMASTTRSRGLIGRFPIEGAALGYDEGRGVLRVSNEEIWLGSFTDRDREALAHLAARPGGG